MEHWLDKKFDDFKKTENKVTDEEKVLKEKKIKENYEKNKTTFEDFIAVLKKLFNKLDFVKEDGFEYYYELKSMEGKPEFNQAQFSGENSTQHPTFLRRFNISFSDKVDNVMIELYRGKRSSDDKPWKFHDEQSFTCEIFRLDEERAYELIDWFAWKIYTPRGLR